jgi:AcrR family transcriptional regulator
MAQDDGPAVPPTIVLAWGRAAPASRGPKRALTLDAVVAAGIAVAVADGIGGVSMARVAERVGVSTMALYRYVPSKDDLLELMVDAGLGTPQPARPGETWRDGLLRWAVGVRDAYRANPWALRVPISNPPLGPNNVAWLENALAALHDTPLEAQQKLSSVLLISGFVRSEELLLHDMMAAVQQGRDTAYAGQLAALITEHEFPEVSAALAAGALDDEDGIDGEFAFGIARILDGIDTLMRSRRRRR